ncbi:KIF-1 binding protein C terminal [Pustulibacterium marinum]|uniref:KIF-1 binding protein C terminal n=1 Tax=Pustulibacterium marinum TaxID=1224947 RepID=A0A1I7ISR9_9FLAO|nr:DUF4349 domain-containing protein [Pustulibacterium marinum]SFU75948.1 KIF-1 binding protein C terminal [Pustulibacterium marinum]
MKKQIGILALCFMALVSCTATQQSAYSETGSRSTINYGLDDTSQEMERKILYSAYISLAVEIPDSTQSAIKAIAKTYKGYVQKSSSNQMVIHVKSEELDAALTAIESLGKLKSKNVSGNDVTTSYFDYKIRLENAEKSRERYLQLLDKATNVSEMVLIEKELERLNETIELLKGNINRIDHFEEFSSITIYFTERKKPGILGYVGIGLYKPIKWLFVRN